MPFLFLLLFSVPAWIAASTSTISVSQAAIITACIYYLVRIYSRASIRSGVR